MVTKKMVGRETAVDCPDCGADFSLYGTVKMGKEVRCPECGAELEVIGTDPVELDWRYDDDYEDDEDEDKDKDW